MWRAVEAAGEHRGPAMISIRILIVRQAVISEVTALVVVIADAQLPQLGEVDMQRAAAVEDILTIEGLKQST